MIGVGKSTSPPELSFCPVTEIATLMNYGGGGKVTSYNRYFGVATAAKT
jgi:hypothetical protein